MTGKMCRKAGQADNTENNSENSKEVMRIQDPRESMLLNNLHYLPACFYRALFPTFGVALFGT